MDAGWVESGTWSRWALTVPTAMMVILGCIVIVPVGETSGYINPGGTGANGNQELLADPSRPLVYYADPLGSTLTILDTETQETWTIDVGTAPMSIDLEPSGTFLYISVSGMDRIVVVDTVFKQFAYDMPLDFSPLSLTVDDSDRLYVSCVDDEQVRVIDASTGEVLDTYDLPDMRILEVSPNGDNLIGASLYTDPVSISRYSIVGNSLHLEATDDHDLGSNFRQIVPDWDNDRLYVGSAVPYGLEVLSIATLDRTGFLQMNRSPTALSLAKDGSVVVGLATDFYSGSLFLFNTTTGDLVGDTAAPLTVDTCALTYDIRDVYLCPGLNRIRVDSVAVPESPVDGTVLGYSPAYISFAIEQGLVAYEPAELPATINGVEYTAVMTDDHTYVVDFDGPIDPSSYEVVVEVEGLTGTNSHSWTFDIDPDSKDAVTPSIVSVSPSFGENVEMIDPLVITVAVDIPDPAPLDANIEIYLDGDLLPTERDLGEEGFVYRASASDIDPGTHDAMTVVDWGLSNTSYAWPFVWRIWPSITPLFPLAWEIVSYGFTEIEMTVDLGDPAAEVWSYSVSVDGTDVSNRTRFPYDTMTVSLEEPLDEGTHYVYVMLDLDIGTVDGAWGFEVVGLPSMVRYAHSNGYSILAPLSWDVTKDEEIGGNTVDIVMRGPVYESFLTNVLVLTEDSPSVEEDEEFLRSQYDLALDGLADEGIPVTVVDGPGYFELSNHSAIEFTIEWDEENIKQIIVAVADEDRGMLLVITCSSTKTSFPFLKILFEGIIDSLEIEPPEEDDVLDDPLKAWPAWLIGVAVASVVCILTVTAMWMRRSSTGGRHASPTRSFCQWCGGNVSEEDTACPSCGRGLSLEAESEKPGPLG